MRIIIIALFFFASNAVAEDKLEQSAASKHAYEFLDSPSAKEGIQFAEKILDAIRSKKYDDAYLLFSPRFREEFSKEKFADLMEGLHVRFGVPSDCSLSGSMKSRSSDKIQSRRLSFSCKLNLPEKGQVPGIVNLLIEIDSDDRPVGALSILYSPKNPTRMQTHPVQKQ